MTNVRVLQSEEPNITTLLGADDVECMIGHTIFGVIVMLNAMYLIIYEGIINGRLSGNRLAQFSLITSICQSISCVCSIYSYNIHVPFAGSAPQIANLAGYVAFSMLSISFTYIFYKIYFDHAGWCTPHKALDITIIGFALCAGVNYIFVYATWDSKVGEAHFQVYEYFIAPNVFFWAFSLIIVYYEVKKKKITFGLSRFEDTRKFTFYSLIIYMILLLLVNIGKLYMISLLKFPVTGLMMVVVTSVLVPIGKSYSTHQAAMSVSPPSEHVDLQSVKNQVVKIQGAMANQKNPPKYSTTSGNWLIHLSTFGERVAIIFEPYRHDTVGHRIDHYSFRPESFQMLFYITFWLYLFIAGMVTYIWSPETYGNNPVLNTFGWNNICVVFDEGPITLFGTTLFIPVIAQLILFEIFDFFRIYNEKMSGMYPANKGWFYYPYRASTFLEVFVFVCFVQATATQPSQSVYGHTLPFLGVTVGLWTMAFKRIFYLLMIGELNPGWKWRLAFGYLASLLVVVLAKASIDIPNLFGAKLWMNPEFAWTYYVGVTCDRLFLVLVLIVPILQFVTLTHKINCVHIVIARKLGTSPHGQARHQEANMLLNEL